MSTNRATDITINEFASALQKGLGRAYLYVKENGLDRVENIMLEAVLHDQSFDPQVEPSRTDWLFSMIRNTTQFPFFRDHIFTALEKETNTWDLLQLCQLTKIMAERGDQQAQKKLRAFVFEIAKTPAEDDWLGAEEWVNYEGIQGILDLARIYGKRLQNDPDDFVNDNLLYYYPFPEAKQVLLENLEREPAIKTYWDYLEQRGLLKEPSTGSNTDAEKAERHQQFRIKNPIDKIIEDAKNKKGSFAGHYVSFGRHATEEERKTIRNLLISETDNDIRTRFLWIFRRTPMPSLENSIFEWANGTHEMLRSAAIAALSQITDPSIHHFAVTKLSSGQLTSADSEVFDLFLKNYAKSDSSIINKALVGFTGSQEDVHSLGFSINKLSKEYEDPGLYESLKWVYENTPCTNCRSNAVEQLNRIGKLDEWVIDECQYDASEHIRSFVIDKNETI